MGNEIFNVKIEKLKKLEQLKKLLEKNKEIIDLSDIIRNIENDISTLKKNEIRLVILGTFGAGKTSLLKGLMGIEFLPIKSGENSSTVVYFKSANEQNQNETSIVKINLEGIREIKLDKQQTKEDLSLFLEKQSGFSADDFLETNKNFLKLKKYLNENELKYIRNKGWEPARDVYTATVFLDNEILNKGIIIVDTPGVGSITENHERITISEIRRSYAFIYLFDSNQFGTESEFNFLRLIWDHRDKLIFVFNKADILMTDKANDKDVEEIISEFKDKIPEDFSKEYLPEIIPLSTVLKFGTDTEIKKIMADLNNNYLNKNKTAEELSNWDGFLNALKAVTDKLKKDDTSNDANKIDVIKYKEDILKRIEESIANLREINNVNLEGKVNKLIQSIKELEENKTRIIDHEIKINYRIEKLKEEIKKVCEEKIGEIESKFENDIEKLSYEELFKEKKHQKPLSIIKTEFYALKDKLEKEIKSDILEYVRDIVNPKNKDNAIQLKENLNLNLESKITLVSSLGDDLKEFDTRKNELEKEIKYFKEKLNEIENYINKEKKYIEFTKTDVEYIKQSISFLEQQISSMNNPPNVEYIKNNELKLLEEKNMCWGLKKEKKFGLVENITIDDTARRRYYEEKDNYARQVQIYYQKLEEYKTIQREKEIKLVELKFEYERLEETIESFKEKINQLEIDKSKKAEEKKAEELKENIASIYNKTILPMKDWCDNLITKLPQMYEKSLKLAKDNIIIELQSEISKRDMELKELLENKNKSEIEKNKKISDLSKIKNEVEMINI